MAPAAAAGPRPRDWFRPPLSAAGACLGTVALLAVVALTREAGQNAKLRALLRCENVEVPCIEFFRLDVDTERLKARLTGGDLALLTSPEAARVFVLVERFDIEPFPDFSAK